METTPSLRFPGSLALWPSGKEKLMDANIWDWFLREASRSTHTIPTCCVWCWTEMYPGIPFPAPWSSTLCQRHYTETKQAHQVRLADRTTTE
jgi:hypothetical protein